MGSDLYFFRQVDTRKIPKRYRKLPEELPESLRFAHLNPKVAALLASKERSQRPDNEDPFGDGLGKKSLLPDISAAFQNVRNQFDSALSNDEDSQRYLFEEARMSSTAILEQLSRIIYFYEDLYNHVPKSLEYQLMSGWKDLTSDITIVPREWQTHEMKEQYAAKQQQEVNSEEDISDTDMLTGRSKSRMGASDRTSSELGVKSNMKKSKAKLGVIDAAEEGDGFLKPDSRLGRRSESRASASGSVLKQHLDLSSISRIGNRRKGSSMSSHRSIAGLSPSFFKSRTKDDLFSMIAETPIDARSTALANPLSYMQTINFQLSNKSFEEKGWVKLKGKQEEIDQTEILEYCVTRLQESMKQIAVQRQKDVEQGFDKAVLVRYYGDTKKETLLKWRKSSVKSSPSPIFKGGKPNIPSIVDERNEGKKLMQASHQDGSTIVYYPSGRPAVIHSAAGFGRPGYYTVVYEDGLDSKMLACFTPIGRGVCYYDNGVVRFLATEKGGHLSEVNGKLIRKWKWPHTSVKITEPLSFQVSSNVIFRCVSQSQMTIVFSCQKEMARFSVGPATDVDDYKFIEESDQLLTTFTFSSKAAKDLMRIFAPVKKSKRKGRKEEETDDEEPSKISPRFDINLVRRVRRMSMMPTLTHKASVENRAAKSMTGFFKRLGRMTNSPRDSNIEDNDETDDKMSKRQATIAKFVIDCIGGTKKETEEKKESVIEHVEKSQIVEKKSKVNVEKSPEVHGEKNSKENLRILQGRTSSSKSRIKESDEGSIKRAKSAKLHVQDAKSPRKSAANLSARKSRTQSQSKFLQVVERLSAPKNKYCSRIDKHLSDTTFTSQPHNAQRKFSVGNVSRQVSDFQRPSRTCSETQGSPNSPKSIMKKPSNESQQEQKISRSQSARLKAKTSGIEDSLKRAHSASYQHSPRELDDRPAVSATTQATTLVVHGENLQQQSYQTVNQQHPGLDIQQSKSFEVPAIVVDDSFDPKNQTTDTHQSVSCRSVIESTTKSSQSMSQRVAFANSNTTNDYRSKLTIDEGYSDLSNQGEDTFDTSSRTSQDIDKSASKDRSVISSIENVEDIPSPPVRRARRSSVMKSIQQFRRKVLAKKGIILSEEDTTSSEEELNVEKEVVKESDSQTSKSTASDIMKLIENFPERVTYDLEADKELAKLQRKAKNLVDDWMEHYRIAIGLSSPYLQNVRDTPAYSIANRHAKSARLSDHQQLIRKAVLGVDYNTSARTARILSAPLGTLNDDDDDDDAKTTATDPRVPTTVTFGDQDDGVVDGSMSPTAMNIINRLTETASRRSTRSKASSARSGSPPRQVPQTDRAPSATSNSRSHCPLVIRQYKLGYERPQCRCSRHHIPFIMDLELDEFIATECPESQLIVIMIVSSLFPGITKAEDMLNEAYNNQNRNRTRPCVQSRSDMFRVFKYDINSAAEMSDHTQPLLLTRHSVVPGMFLIYCDGKLLFCDHIFNGYGNTRKDFKKQVMKSRHDAIHGLCLPKDFKFSPGRGRSGMRSAWGGEIGGAGVDKYSSTGTVIDMGLQPIHRPSSSSSGQSKEVHIDAVRSTSRRPFLPQIDTSQTGTSSETYQYESVHDWVSASLPGIQSSTISNSTSFATSLSETTY